MKIIKIIMLALTLFYSVLMVSLSGAGLIYNRENYGKNLETVGFFLILSSLLMLSGSILSFFRKKIISVISIILSLSGLALCLSMLFLLCNHADNAGWHDNYTLAPVSEMYKSRITPVIAPSLMSVVISFLNMKKNRK